MSVPGQRVSGEGSSRNGGAGASNHQLLPSSENKKVCRFCKREFKCGRSLGGHIKAHKRKGRTTRFTHKKKSNRRGVVSSSTPTPLRVVMGARGASGAAPVRMVENGARGAGISAPLMRNNRDSGAEIRDVSMSLLGCGWKKKGRRGSNEERSRMIIVNHSYSDDEYVECDVEDSCDEDDYDNIKLRKWLRSRGYATGAHKISWTKRFLMCKVCNEYFRNMSGVINHVDECTINSGEVEMEIANARNAVDGGVEVDQVVDGAVHGQQGNGQGEIGRMPEDAAMRKDNGGSSGVGEKQPASTSASTHTKHQLDLNEVPPSEHD